MGKFILNQTKYCIGLLFVFEKNRQNGNWFLRVMVDSLEGNKAIS